MTLVVKLPSDSSCVLAHDDAEQLVAALWDVSATPGAVVVVGKVRHALSSTGELAIDDDELDAVRTALSDRGELAPGLDELRRVAAAR